MGLPWIEAPSEGEAQAAHMTKKGDADYCASQDYDSLLFGAPTSRRAKCHWKNGSVKAGFGTYFS
jgi:5'-3' exonuclease